jgi:hypothetical protein
MCDYSLMSFPNRLAVVGEELSSHRFPSSSMGFASTVDLQRAAEERDTRCRSLRGRLKEWLADLYGRNSVAAVCIPPGASLLLLAIPVRLQPWWDVGAVETVTFLQTSTLENTHRDAILFANGRRLSIQSLPCGLRARVISLSSSNGLSLPSSEEFGVPEPHVLQM